MLFNRKKDPQNIITTIKVFIDEKTVMILIKMIKRLVKSLLVTVIVCYLIGKKTPKI